MAEKVLHEWESGGDVYMIIRLGSGNLCAVVRDQHPDGTPYWITASDEASWSEILRLSADLARARAEGQLEGVQKATDEIVLRMPCPGLDPDRDETKRIVMGVLNRHIASAERELEGGE